MKSKSSIFLGMLFSVVFFGSLLPNNFSCAVPTTPNEGITGGFLDFNRSIVPCGRNVNDVSTTAYDESDNCTLCHLLIMIKNVFDLLFAWLIIVALVLITIGGVMYIISSGNAGLKTTAKGIITKTLAGFAIFILSWLIVYVVLTFLSANDSSFGLNSGGVWYEFNCDPTTSPFNDGSGVVPPPPPPTAQCASIHGSAGCYQCAAGNVINQSGYQCGGGPVGYDCSWVCTFDGHTGRSCHSQGTSCP